MQVSGESEKMKHDCLADLPREASKLHMAAFRDIGYLWKNMINLAAQLHLPCYRFAVMKAALRLELPNYQCIDIP